MEVHEVSALNFSEMEKPAVLSSRRGFLGAGFGLFSLWIVSGGSIAESAASSISVPLDMPLFRNLAFTVSPGTGYVQFTAKSREQGILIYGVDVRGARALARFPVPRFNSRAPLVSGQDVFALLVREGIVQDAAPESHRFQEFLTVAVSTGLLVANSGKQRVTNKIGAAGL